jgi:hypothetical protein
MSKRKSIDPSYEVSISGDKLYCIAAGSFVSQPLFCTSFAESIEDCVDDVLRQANDLEERMGWLGTEAAKKRCRAKILRALKSRGTYDECEDEGIFMRLETIIIKQK